MIQPDSSTPRGLADALVAPPPLLAGNQPPPLPAPAKKSKALLWLLVAGGGLLLLAFIGAGAVMMLHTLTADVREAKSARRSTPAPAAVPSSGSGLTYQNVKVASEPWSIHVLKIDRSRKDLAFYSAHARDKVLGVSLIAEQARAVPRELGRAVAGVNGDFYLRDHPLYAGDPRGLQIVNGELISGPDTACVWFDAEGHPHLGELKSQFAITWPDGRQTPFGLNQQRSGPPALDTNTAVLFTPTYGPSTRATSGRELVLEKAGDGPWLPLRAAETYRARLREISPAPNTRLAADTLVLALPPQLSGHLNGVKPGDVLEISTATTPELKGVKAAIAGGPAIVKDGKAVISMNPPPGLGRDYSQRSKYERHPRSSVGWSPTHVYLITVDGRQPGHSVGMKLAELAEYFLSLGCTHAMNFDGGKSAQMWMEGRIMNSPAQGEDTVANSLLVLRQPEK